MKTTPRLGRWTRTVAAFWVVLACAAACNAQELTVLTSGAFRAALTELVPEFERATRNTIVTVSGASVGDGPTTIPNRLARREPADVVILADEALAELVQRGEVVPGSRVPLVRSSIGVAVRAGAPTPDISSVDALRRALLAATSIAYSTSASGVYVSTELLPALGIADQIRSKCKAIEVEPVGAVVARGEAELGFQQVSEFQAVPGITIVGPLPPGAQRVTVFSAGVVAYSKRPEAARDLIRFLALPEAAPTIRKSGLEPLSSP